MRLLENVCNATQDKPILRKSIKLVYAEKPGSLKRLKIDKEAGEITIFQADKVKIEEVVPHLIKAKRAQKHFSDNSLVISWTAVQENLPSRGVDDIRGYWNLKLLPILGYQHQTKNGNLYWSENDDIELLQTIADQEVNEADEPIDFSSEMIGNNRS